MDKREKIVSIFTQKGFSEQIALGFAKEILALFPKTLTDEEIAEKLYTLHREINWIIDSRFPWERLQKNSPKVYQQWITLASALSGKIKQELPPQGWIDELKYEELCVCDYADTDKIIEHILTLAKKINELIRTHNAKEGK